MSKFDSLPEACAPRGPAAFLTVRKVAINSALSASSPTPAGPRTRGPRGRSRPKPALFVAGGAREITLLGQNVNAWRDGTDAAGLAGLLRRLAAIDGLERLRYTTSHPADMSDALIRAHGDCRN